MSPRKPDEPVRLTRIYTRTGDAGETHLGDMSRVPKTHSRSEAYGTVDELNALLGVALTIPDMPYSDWLRRVQNDLFDVGADISVPAGRRQSRSRLGLRHHVRPAKIASVPELDPGLPSSRATRVLVASSEPAAWYTRASRRDIPVTTS